MFHEKKGDFREIFNRWDRLNRTKEKRHMSSHETIKGRIDDEPKINDVSRLTYFRSIRSVHKSDPRSGRRVLIALSCPILNPIVNWRIPPLSPHQAVYLTYSPHTMSVCQWHCRNSILISLRPECQKIRKGWVGLNVTHDVFRRCCFSSGPWWNRHCRNLQTFSLTLFSYKGAAEMNNLMQNCLSTRLTSRMPGLQKSRLTKNVHRKIALGND